MYDADQLAQLEQLLAQLGSAPTAVDVLTVTEAYDAHIVAAEGVCRALGISAGGGGPMTLTDLTDVTGTPGPNKAPVYDADSGVAPLTQVPTQADLDAILDEVVWHKIHELTAPWQPSNGTVRMTPDGIAFGPYPDGTSVGGSIRYLGLNGQPFSVVRNLVYNVRYVSDDQNLEAGAAPYLRVFTQDASGGAHDAIFTPGSQPYTGLGAGPFQEFAATAGTWRYDADDGSGGVPLEVLQAQYGDHTITKIGITVGFTAGMNLAALLSWWRINGDTHIFLGDAQTADAATPKE